MIYDPLLNSLPGNVLADSLAKIGASLDPSNISVSLAPLFPLKGNPSTPVGDAVSNLVSFYTKSLQYLPRSSLSLAPLAVLSPVYAATGTALSLTLISTGLVEPRLHAATVVLNHRTFLTLVLDCPVLDHLHRAIFGHTLSLLDLWFRPWGVARLLGLCGVDPNPHP